MRKRNPGGQSKAHGRTGTKPVLCRGRKGRIFFGSPGGRPKLPGGKKPNLCPETDEKRRARSPREGRAKAQRSARRSTGQQVLQNATPEWKRPPEGRDVVRALLALTRIPQ